MKEEDQLVIPLLQAKRSAVLSRLAKLHQEDAGAEEGKEEAKETGQAVEEDSKPLTLEEKAERALLEGEETVIWTLTFHLIVHLFVTSEQEHLGGVEIFGSLPISLYT